MTGAAKYAATAVFAVIVLASGVLHGLQTHRWIEPPSLDQYVARIKNVPEKFDNWTSTSSRFQDDLTAHGIADYTLLNFSNKQSTDNFQVLVVCGRPGPIASHTPDVCYRGEGFTTTSDPKRMDFIVKEEGTTRGRSYPLYQLKLSPPKTKAIDYELEIRWAWMPPNKGLMAPESPRMEFANQPALYKVYIIHKKPAVAVSQLPTAGSTLQVPSNAPKANVADISAFLEKFLPQLEAALRDPNPAP